MPVQTACGEVTEIWGPLRFGMASVNVLTLNSPDRRTRAHPREVGIAMQLGKHTFPAQCLAEAGVHVAAVQQSRCEKGVVKSMGTSGFVLGPLLDNMVVNCGSRPDLSSSARVIWCVSSSRPTSYFCTPILAES